MTLSGKVVVFTDTLERVTEAGLIAEERGAVIGRSITRATDYLVVGDKPGTKLTRAKAMGVTVLSENEFFGLVNGDSHGD